MTSQDDLALLKGMHQRGEITDPQYDVLRRHVLWGTPLPELMDDVPASRAPVDGYVPGAATVGPGQNPDPPHTSGWSAGEPGGRRYPTGAAEPAGPPARRYASRRERREAEEAGQSPPPPPYLPPAGPAPLGPRHRHRRAGTPPATDLPAGRSWSDATGALPATTARPVQRPWSEPPGELPPVSPDPPRRRRWSTPDGTDLPPAATDRPGGRRWSDPVGADLRPTPTDDPRGSRWSDPVGTDLPEALADPSRRRRRASPDTGRGPGDRRGVEEDGGRRRGDDGARQRRENGRGRREEHGDRRPRGTDGTRRRGEDGAAREPETAKERRRPHRRSVFAVLTSVVLALALAAGGVYWFVLRADGAPPAAYARDTCGAVRDWQQSVDSSNATLITQISRQQNKTTVRSDVTAYYTTIAGRTDQLRTAILGLGPADIGGGREYADSLAAAVGDQATALRRLADRAARLDPEAATFPTDLQTVLTGADSAVSAVSAALARPAAGITTDLRTTLSNEPTCAPYVG
jgi:hypothetical protein